MKSLCPSHLCLATFIVMAGNLPNVVQADTPAPVAMSEMTPYRQTELRVTSPEGHIMVGEVLLPLASGFVPVVILISGTGRQERDFEAFDGRYHLHRDLADALLLAGIGVARFDERNTGASTCDYRTARSADLRTDAQLIFDQAAEVEGVDCEAMFIFGHIEGAIFAMQLAASDPLVAGIAIAGAPYRSGRAMTWDQVQSETPRPKTMSNIEYQALLQQTYADEIEFQRTRPSLADLLDHDGEAMAAKVHKPVLILEAQNDWQVKSVRLDNVGHRLTANPSDITDYAKLTDLRVAPKVNKALTTWTIRTAIRTETLG